MFSAMIKVVKSKYDKILQKQSPYSKDAGGGAFWHFGIIEEQRRALKIFSMEKMFCCIPDWFLQCNWQCSKRL